MKRVGVTVDNVGNRIKWKLRTRVADLKYIYINNFGTKDEGKEEVIFY